MLSFLFHSFMTFSVLYFLFFFLSQNCIVCALFPLFILLSLPFPFSKLESACPSLPSSSFSFVILYTFTLWQPLIYSAFSLFFFIAFTQLSSFPLSTIHLLISRLFLHFYFISTHFPSISVSFRILFLMFHHFGSHSFFLSIIPLFISYLVLHFLLFLTYSVPIHFPYVPPTFFFLSYFSIHSVIILFSR